MGHLLPRKIKKACKACRKETSLKTKWRRYICLQVSGRTDRYMPYVGDWETLFTTKYGKLLSEYVDYGTID